MDKTNGIIYLRTARPATEVIYDGREIFKIGGSKILRKSKKDKVTVVAAGLTVLEALRAHGELLKRGVDIRVVDAYSLKPMDGHTLEKCAAETGNLIITVEDHFAYGGLGDAVLEVFAIDSKVRVFKLAVTKMPGSATPEEQYKFEGIDSSAIVSKVLKILG
jgi:transketolase